MKICPNCSWENQDEFNFCLGCGYQLSSASASQPADAQAPATTASASGEPGVSANPKPVEAPAAPQGQECPACGANIPADHVFCGQCGHRITAPPETKAGPSAAAQTVASVAPTPEAPARLVLLLPNGEEGGSYPLKGDVTQIGRSKGNILFLDDPYVSPLHATFYYDNGQLRVRNENSFNGLFIRLRKRVVLQHGDVVLLGKQLLRFEALEARPEVASDMDIHQPPPTPIWGSPFNSYWGRLVQLIAGGFEGNAILLGGEQVELGRERGQITFPGDRFISSLHARLSLENQQHFVEDVGSRNGTFVQIRGDHALSHKDILIIGEQLLRVEINA